MIHPNSAFNHPIENWVYANAAARTGATGFVTGDIGKIAYQSDNGTYWRLTATTPAWSQVMTVTVGVTDGSNAGPGMIGEYVESNILIGSEITLTSGAFTNVTSISLSAGDWDVSGTVDFDIAGTTTITLIAVGVSLTTAAFEAPYRNDFRMASLAPGAVQWGCVAPIRRISISATTTVYLVCVSAFATSTCKAYGVLRARRVR